MTASFFAPIFFALASLNSDLTVLKSPTVLGLTAALVVVASLGKMRAARLEAIAAGSTSGVGFFIILVAVGRVHSAEPLLEMIANERVAIAGARF